MEIALYIRPIIIVIIICIGLFFLMRKYLDPMYKNRGLIHNGITVVGIVTEKYIDKKDIFGTSTGDYEGAIKNITSKKRLPSYGVLENFLMGIYIDPTGVTHKFCIIVDDNFKVFTGLFTLEFSVFYEIKEGQNIEIWIDKNNYEKYYINIEQFKK